MIHNDPTNRLGPLLVAACLVGAAIATTCNAHETDQFNVPQGKEFANLGDYFNEYFITSIEKVLSRLNRQIDWTVHAASSRHNLRLDDIGPRRRKLSGEELAKELEIYYSPDTVAREVKKVFGSAVTLIEGLERKFKSRKLKKRYPGKIISYHPKAASKSIYQGLYFPLDPRNVSVIFFASTIMVNGTYMGTDKIGHFTDMGYHYFKAYRQARKDGKDDEQAMLDAAKLGMEGLLSEESILGYVSAGSYSNADLVSNYVGCLFYRNLTEPVVIKGRLLAPALVRDGAQWTLAPHVRGELQFFERYVSDHFDEALNPSLWQEMSRDTLRKKLAKRCDSLLAWYKPKYGDRDANEYFNNLVRELSTYHGQDYGHRGQPDNELVHIGNTCQ